MTSDTQVMRLPRLQLIYPAFEWCSIGHSVIRNRNETKKRMREDVAQLAVKHH